MLYSISHSLGNSEWKCYSKHEFQEIAQKLGCHLNIYKSQQAGGKPIICSEYLKVPRLIEFSFVVPRRSHFIAFRHG